MFPVLHRLYDVQSFGEQRITNTRSQGTQNLPQQFFGETSGQLDQCIQAVVLIFDRRYHIQGLLQNVRIEHRESLLAPCQEAALYLLALRCTQALFKEIVFQPGMAEDIPLAHPIADHEAGQGQQVLFEFSRLVPCKAA